MQRNSCFLHYHIALWLMSNNSVHCYHHYYDWCYVFPPRVVQFPACDRWLLMYIFMWCLVTVWEIKGKHLVIVLCSNMKRYVRDSSVLSSNFARHTVDVLLVGQTYGRPTFYLGSFFGHCYAAAFLHAGSCGNTSKTYRIQVQDATAFHTVHSTLPHFLICHSLSQGLQMTGCFATSIAYVAIAMWMFFFLTKNGSYSLQGYIIKYTKQKYLALCMN